MTTIAKKPKSFKLLKLKEKRSKKKLKKKGLSTRDSEAELINRLIVIDPRL